MNIQKIVIAFASGVIALVIGWFIGGAARDLWGDQYEVAVGVVEVAAGAPVATASPPPSVEPTDEPTDPPTATPVDTPGSILCDGAPPGEDCDCDLQDGEWVWVCEAPTETATPTPFPTFADPSPSPSPTP